MGVFMQLLEKIGLFPDFSQELLLCAVLRERELACLKTAPAF
jgi:hypothetical protein